MAPGDTDRPVDDGDDLAERLADPVLAAARAVAPPAGALPDVWGRLVEGLVEEPDRDGPAGPGGADLRGGDGQRDGLGPARRDGQDATGPEPIAEAAVEARARDLLDQMTVHEKQHLLAGDVPFARGLSGMVRTHHDTLAVAGALPRLGVPGIRCSDGPGAAQPAGATTFPAPVARAATFDPDLETRVGDAIGAERRALGANLYAGVCADVVRHPAWRRAHEAYGEDLHLVSEMAPALVRGVQRHVMACVRHLACGSTVRDDHRVDIAVDDDDLRDIYLPPFRRCVDEGVAAVMTAAHSLDGVPCGHHRHLISTVLKGEWGFDGFVMTDFAHGARSGRAVAAGQDLEMPFCWRFRGLGRLVRQGRVSPDRVDDAALRLLRQQVRAAARVHGHGPDTDARSAPTPAPAAWRTEHRTLARQVAERSIVLLRNHTAPGLAPADDHVPGGHAEQAAGPQPIVGAAHERVLPLDPDRVQSMAVFGRLAAPTAPTPGAGPETRLGTGPAGAETAASRAAPGPPTPDVSVLDGLRAAGERWVISVAHQSGDDLDAAGLAAAANDVAVVVAGRTAEEAGAAGERRDDNRALCLRAHDEALIRTVAAANPRTVVVLVGGSAIVSESWRYQVGAVVMAWHPGAEGGNALARVLFGEVVPGGRLPVTWPRAAEQLPPSGAGSRTVRYGPLHGYRLMQAMARPPAFPFGFGLSYTTFEHGRAVARPAADGSVRLTVPVVNTGTRDGDEVVQVYLDEALGSDPRPLRTLRAFRRVTVAAGAMVNVTFDLDRDVLARTAAAHGGTVRLHVGRDADPAGHRTVTV